MPMVEYGVVRSPEEKQKAYGLRLEVFVREQKVPEDMELDEFDAEAIHAIAKDGETVVGTGRLVVEEDRGRIGRMAVQKERRKEGIGKGLMEVLESKAIESGLTEVYLHAQVHAEDFYAKMGYAERGEEFDEAGIAHIEMYKNLKLVG